VTDLVLRPDVRIARLAAALPALILLVNGLQDDRPHGFTIACLVVGIVFLAGMLVWRRYAMTLELADGVVRMKVLRTRSVPVQRIARAVRARTWSSTMWLLLDTEGHALLAISAGDWNTDALLDRLGIPCEQDDRHASFAQLADRYPGSVPRWGRHPVALGVAVASLFFLVTLIPIFIMLF
jgi:hypothetical protein